MRERDRDRDRERPTEIQTDNKIARDGGEET